MKAEKILKVVHIGTGISNSSAPLRIHNAVKAAGVDSSIVTLTSSVESADIYEIKRNFGYKCVNKIMSYYERKMLERYENRKNTPFSFGQIGVSLTNEVVIKEADVLHLHWINGQFLSYKEIRKLILLGKPIVWTFHDSWPMTGGCHVRYGCDGFAKDCGCCPELHSMDENDITRKILCKKKKYYECERMTIACPSEWMKNNVKRSSIFTEYEIIQIGNPIDLNIFRRCSNKIDEEKINLLFGANGALELEYKGYKYFVEALQYIKKNDADIAKRLVIQIFGTDSSVFEGLEDFTVEALGYIRTEEEMAKIYSGADIYVFPSIDDNLPGTVMESLACETPVVAFKTGGVPEMVQHKQNGYIAEYKNSVDLAQGILWVIENNEENVLGLSGRSSVTQEYSMELIGRKYNEIYHNMIKRGKNG